MKVCTVLPRAPSKRPINAERAHRRALQGRGLSTARGCPGRAEPRTPCAPTPAPCQPQDQTRAAHERRMQLPQHLSRPRARSSAEGSGGSSSTKKGVISCPSLLVRPTARGGAGRLGPKEQHAAPPRHRFSSRPPPPAPRGHPGGEAEPPRGAQPRGLAQGSFRKRGGPKGIPPV